MILLYMWIFGYIFYKKLHALSRYKRQILISFFIIYIVAMVAYELYVENSVGWEYGIPYDNDTGWIFRAADAMHSGISWDRLYLLVTSSLDYDLSNRALSISNLGQYLYAAWVSSAIYYPTIFDIHVNLYLFYVVQCMMVFIAGIDLSNTVLAIQNRIEKPKKIPYISVCFAFLFCPIIQFSAYKLLRESIYLLLMVELLAIAIQENTGKKYLKCGVLSTLCLLIRPLTIVYIVPLLAYYIFHKRIGSIVNMALCGILLAGSSIVHYIGNLLGWAYNIGAVNLSEMVHLLLFPNVMNQFENLVHLARDPSWVTIEYFLQSVWNIPYVVLAFLGFILMRKRTSDWSFWSILFLNCLMFYSIPYSIEYLTPRYKLIFIVPLFYFIAVGLSLISKRVRVSI
ncbi:hypothetical protein [Desulfosporosinus meridiei]|uniref:Uncharacterized protein n=1 Tax=Desulfosporosinus meridiei (strain ATCC BAA-275 / DSM 13257 / KCTC 12902 / NCIMB 13706 / S10) TaxID=768704 RepID=J7IW65_DESMD|nr:hypothetical protein [Desulfosporosinus meridiei]AFQ45985.1 hypothetical protein Desmer_4157 [Desulfosporosinus meridiei DSM 13257]